MKQGENFYRKISARLPSFWYIIPSLDTITPEISVVFSRVAIALDHGITQSAVA